MSYHSQAVLCLTGIAAAKLKKIAQYSMQESTFMHTHTDIYAEYSASGAELPPEDLTTLGRKRIALPEKLRIFSTF